MVPSELACSVNQSSEPAPSRAPPPGPAHHPASPVAAKPGHGLPEHPELFHLNHPDRAVVTATSEPGLVHGRPLSHLQGSVISAGRAGGKLSLYFQFSPEICISYPLGLEVKPNFGLFGEAI